MSAYYPYRDKQNQKAQFLVALLEGVAQALEPGRVAGEFKDSDNSHNPKKLSNSSDLYEVITVLAHPLAYDAHIIPRNVFSFLKLKLAKSYGKTARKSITFIGFRMNLHLSGHLHIK